MPVAEEPGHHVRAAFYRLGALIAPVTCQAPRVCASAIVLSSGGVQEEAPSFGVPVLVLRNRTERLEGVSAGCARLVGTDAAAIVAGFADVLAETAARESSSPYGDGRAGQRIADILAR